MPKEVRAALLSVLQRFGADGNGWSVEQAEAHLRRMERERRYQVEAW
jgi:sulfite reductase alpha subunit-like flavoprotein